MRYEILAGVQPTVDPGPHRSRRLFDQTVDALESLLKEHPDTTHVHVELRKEIVIESTAVES